MESFNGKLRDEQFNMEVFNTLAEAKALIRVLESTVRVQLGSSLVISWNKKGLVCEMELPLGRDPAVAMEGRAD